MASQNVVQCVGTTKKGTRCKNDAVEGRNTCRYHHPETNVDPGQPSQPRHVTVALDHVDQMSVDAIDQRLAALKAEEKALKKQRKQLMNTKRYVTKARLLYYHARKTDDAVIKELRTRLVHVGLLMVRKVKVGRTTVDKEIIPWHMVKQACDILFDNEPADVKQQYMNQAKTIINSAD
jgi:uncharacterized small protein (DUF1192 family)